MKEQFSNTSETEIKYANQEILQYSDGNGNPDGHLVLSFSGEGEVNSKYVDWHNPMLIETESGNRYAAGTGFGGGDIIMLNGREGTIHAVDILSAPIPADNYRNDIIPIVLGERLEVPVETPNGEVATITTTPVTRVFAKYPSYSTPGRDSRAHRYIDTPSPMVSVERALIKAQHLLRDEKYK